MKVDQLKGTLKSLIVVDSWGNERHGIGTYIGVAGLRMTW